MADYRSLEDFLAADAGAAWISYRVVNAYVRRQSILVERELRRVLCCANIINTQRRWNIVFDPRFRASRTGLLREFDALLHEHAVRLRLDGVYYENVHTDFLQAALKRYGYMDVSHHRGVADEHLYRAVLRPKDGSPP